MAADYRVCFDVIGAQELAWDRGIPRYIAEHGKALGALDRSFELLYRADPRLPLMPPAQQFAAGGRLRRTRQAPWADDGTPSILHMTSPFELQEPDEVVWPRWSRGGDWTTVATVWDLIPLIVPGYLHRRQFRRELYLQRLELLKTVDHLLAISQHTAADIERHLGVDPSRITVIDAGVDQDRFGTLATDEATEIARAGVPGLRDRFLFYVGGDDPRKNMEGLIRAFGRSRARRDGVQLVLGGTISEPRRPHFARVIADAGAAPGDVLIAGHVDDRTLAALYAACTLFVFPSLYEGSGLPMLEAMAAGAPVIAANTSTGPEIVGIRDATFDPHDLDDIARAIDRAIGDSAWLAELRARSAARVRRYTWEHVARCTVDGYERALARGWPARRRPLRRPGRLAVVSPLPPERSGIADYTARLVDGMREHTDQPIDVIVSDISPAEPGPGILRESAFRAAVQLGTSYDAVLFQLGNSGFHSHMLDLMPWVADQGVPVTALLHEARLSGIFTDGIRAGRLRRDRLVSFVREHVPLLAEKPAHEILPFVEAEGLVHGLFLSGAAVQGAEHILVHSALARELVLADRGDDVGPPVEIVPFGAPEPRGTPAATCDPDLIVSTGIVAAIKDVGTLLQAFALLRAERPTARLVLAGSHGPADDLAVFARMIAELGIEDAVSLPGYVDDEERWELLSTAAVVVQLRQHSHGEASAAVMDALAAGTPTVVTDLGWMAELPRDAVVHVAAVPAPSSLAAVISGLLDDPDRAAEVSRAARRFVARRSFVQVGAAVLDAWPGAPAPTT